MVAKLSRAKILAARRRASFSQVFARLIAAWETGSVPTYLLAIALIALATMLRAIFGLLTSDMVSSYATYYPAIIVVTLIGGAGTGAFALALSGVISLIVFVPPLFSIHLNASDAVSLALFIVSGSFVVAVSSIARGVIPTRAADLASQSQALNERVAPSAISFPRCFLHSTTRASSRCC